MMGSQEIPLCFECAGEASIGIVHAPIQPKRRGILMIIAGGPQYRAGVGRQLVIIARSFASQGTPVMRFDYRGTGDSSGKHLDFEEMGPDLDAAIHAFMQTVPSVTEIILWGGCNAASAVLMDGPNNPHVTGMIISNPWVHSEAIHQKALRQYYLRRLTQKSFWIKFVTFKINPIKILLSTLFGNRDKITEKPETLIRSKRQPFQTRMLIGAQKFQGKILLIISGRSVVSQEFKALVASNSAWRHALKRDGVTWKEFSDANQTFSTNAARNNLINTAVAWLDDWSRDVTPPPI